MTVRFEQPVDLGATRAVLCAAFGQSLEADIVDSIRNDGHVTCSLVADDGSDVIGHILFSPVTIEEAPDARAAGLAPMAVHPDHQRRGIGTALVEVGLRECARLGIEVVVVLGHPEFYPRFGFRPARDFGLRSEFPVPDDVFMALELVNGALAGRCGLVRYLPHFGA